jgi:UDPglucose 6-dehydrogenase/GDP-mannose 6-dehydrogenase
LHSQKITIVGTGYVGLVTGASLASLGHSVTCIDVRQEVVDLVNRGVAPFFEPGLPERIRESFAAGRFCASIDLASAVADSDVTFIAVGTPSTPEGIDLSAVVAAAESIGDALAGRSTYHVVVVKSTVIPGTTAGIVKQTLLARSERGPDTLGICMNPEFLREGSAVADFTSPDRIVIGESDPRAGDAVARLYSSFTCPIVRTSLGNAELIKYASNTLLATLISYSNEVAALCERLPDTDVEVVMDAVHLDRRLSPTVDGRRISPGILRYLRAGAGFGGSCLPKDVNALRAFAHSLGVDTPIFDATMKVNERRPNQVVDLVERAVGRLPGKAVAVLGLTFKPGTDDVRDSPALALIESLKARRCLVRAYDPLLSRDSAAQAPIPLSGTPEIALIGADAAVIATSWPEFCEWEWDRLYRLMRSPIIVDGRGTLRHVRLPPAVRYWPIGRAPE